MKGNGIGQGKNKTERCTNSELWEHGYRTLSFPGIEYVNLSPGWPVIYPRGHPQPTEILW